MENGSAELVYEIPELVEVGDFAQLTLGGGYIGADNFWQTEWF
jgi:hypothetical protein